MDYDWVYKPEEPIYDLEAQDDTVTWKCPFCNFPEVDILKISKKDHSIIKQRLLSTAPELEGELKVKGILTEIAHDMGKINCRKCKRKWLETYEKEGSRIIYMYQS